MAGTPELDALKIRGLTTKLLGKMLTTLLGDLVDDTQMEGVIRHFCGEESLLCELDQTIEDGIDSMVRSWKSKVAKRLKEMANRKEYKELPVEGKPTTSTKEKSTAGPGTVAQDDISEKEQSKFRNLTSILLTKAMQRLFGDKAEDGACEELLLQFREEKDLLADLDKTIKDGIGEIALNWKSKVLRRLNEIANLESGSEEPPPERLPAPTTSQNTDVETSSSFRSFVQSWFVNWSDLLELVFILAALIFGKRWLQWNVKETSEDTPPESTFNVRSFKI